MRRLQRQRPGVHHAVVIVVALPAEGPALRPRLDDQVVGFLEALAVEGRVDAGGELLLAAAAHEARDQPAPRDHVDHGQLLGEPERVVGERQRVAEQDDLHPLRDGGQDRREDVGLGLHAERGVVVLVEHDAVEAHALGQAVVLDVLVVEAAARHGVEVAVGEHQRGGAEVTSLVHRICRHRLLGEVHEVHGRSRSGLRCEVDDGPGQLGRPLHVHEVSCVLDHGQPRVGQGLGVALTALQRDDPIVASPHDEGRGLHATEEVGQAWGCTCRAATRCGRSSRD